MINLEIRFSINLQFPTISLPSFLNFPLVSSVSLSSMQSSFVIYRSGSLLEIRKRKDVLHYVATSSFDAVRTERKFRKKFIFTRLRTLTGTNLYKVTDVAQLIELDSLNFEECERCEAILDLYLCNEHLYISSKQFSCYRSRYSVRR